MAPPESVIPPVSTFKAPVPLNKPVYVKASLRLKISVPLLITLADKAPKEPSVAPVPACKVPELSVVLPA